MRTKTKFKGTMLALMAGVLLSGFSYTTYADDNSCGNQAKWSYDAEKKALTITGKGSIYWVSEWDKLKIKEVVLKSGISTIEDSTFSGMTDLKKVTIPKSVTNIGSCAFENTSIKSIKIEDTIKKLGYGVFFDCDKLETVEWDYRIIPDDTFHGCDNLDKITFSNKLKKIENNAFYNSGIKSINLPSSVKYIGESAFAATKNLKSIVIPENVKEIERETFEKSGIESIKFDGNITTIKEYAFNRSKIKSIDIVDSVTNVGERAFADCKKLTSVKIGNGLTTIKKETFDGCKKLSNISFGSKLNFIGESAFNNCKSLEKIDFPMSLDTIDYAAFKGSGLKNVDLSKVGKYVDYWVFSECDKLESISIGAQIEEFHVNSVANCKSLKKIVIDPNNTEYASDGSSIVDKLDNRLLLVAGGVSGTYKIPKDVNAIDPEAFYGCSKIQGYDTSENYRFKTINGVLFRDVVYKGQTGLALVACPITKTGSYTIPSTTIGISASAFQNSQITSVKIPNSVKYIGTCAFEECKGLKKIVIPGSVLKISNSAFWGCSNLERVQIKKGVKYIRRNAFKDCGKLTRIEIPNSVIRIAKTSFKGCEDVTFYCKKSSRAMSYANTKWFIKYKII